VEAGPYSWSRNPQYVAFTAIYMGITLLLGTGWPLILLPLVIGATVAAVIAREERYMRTAFGADYEDYCRRVPRWL
jgi:protein-S-isoprenylcysteine O-methyltransferase Ste14